MDKQVKLRQFGITAKDIEKNSNTPLPLAVGSALSAQYYALDMDVTYTISTATQTMSDYAFMENIISNINFEAGAGSKVIDLNIRDLFILNLINRGSLQVSIPKTVGTHTAKITLIIDMNLVRHRNPKDSIFHTYKYDHRYINIEGNSWDKYAQVSVASAKVRLYEFFKENSRPNDIFGTGVDYNVIKKPIMKEISIVGTESEKEIELPKGKKVLGAVIYAINKDTEEIVEGCISQIQIKNAQTNYGKIPFDSLHRINRMSGILDIPTSAYFNNMVYVDFAQGEIPQGIDTNLTDSKDTALYLDLDENGISKPKLRILFLTVDNKI